MDETEAANLLGNQSPGHFLIRISSSRAVEGVFVLAVKTLSGVVQIQIEVSLESLHNIHRLFFFIIITFLEMVQFVKSHTQGTKSGHNLVSITMLY